MPKMQPVSSSNISHIGYDEPSKELHITSAAARPMRTAMSVCGPTLI